MTETNQSNKMLTLGRLNKREKNGKTYFTGSIMVDRLKDAAKFTDARGNVKFGIVVFHNDYKKEDKDADYKIYESRPKEETQKTADDLPF